MHTINATMKIYGDYREPVLEKCNNKIEPTIKGASGGSADVMLIHCLETATKCDFWGFPHVLLCQASPPFQLQPQLPSLPKSILAHQWVYPVSVHTARGLVLHLFCLSPPLFAKVEQNLSVHVSSSLHKSSSELCWRRATCEGSTSLNTAAGLHQNHLVEGATLVVVANRCSESSFQLLWFHVAHSIVC